MIRRYLCYVYFLISRQVLALDASNVEAIACLAADHFYSDQPELALRYYRRLLQVRLGTRACCAHKFYTLFVHAVLLACFAVLVLSLSTWCAHWRQSCSGHEVHVAIAELCLWRQGFCGCAHLLFHSVD
jgi:hypothetical protein